MRSSLNMHLQVKIWLKSWVRTEAKASYPYTNPWVGQSVDTKSLSTLGLYKDQLRTEILKNKYQLGTKSDSKKED